MHEESGVIATHFLSGLEFGFYTARDPLVAPAPPGPIRRARTESRYGVRMDLPPSSSRKGMPGRPVEGCAGRELRFEQRAEGRRSGEFTSG